MRLVWWLSRWWHRNVLGHRVESGLAFYRCEDCGKCWRAL